MVNIIYCIYISLIIFLFLINARTRVCSLVTNRSCPVAKSISLVSCSFRRVNWLRARNILLRGYWTAASRHGRKTVRLTHLGTKRACRRRAAIVLERIHPRSLEDGHATTRINVVSCRRDLRGKIEYRPSAWQPVYFSGKFLGKEEYKEATDFYLISAVSWSYLYSFFRFARIECREKL